LNDPLERLAGDAGCIVDEGSEAFAPVVHAGSDPGQDMRQDGSIHMGVFREMRQLQAEHRMIFLR
jgi:hypothetical protein